MIKGILFDVDGVIFDSEEFIRQSYYDWYKKRHNIKITYEDLLPYTGTGEPTSIEGLGKTFGLDFDLEEDKKGIYDCYEQIIQGVLKPMPGVRAFIENAKKAGLKLSLATSADRTKLNSSMKATGLGPENFDFIVSGDMVTRTKPDGSIYRYAASGLVLPNEECLVVEDALSGHIAAKRAGSPSLGVESSFPAEPQILSGADCVIKDLSAFPAFSTLEEFNEKWEQLCRSFREKSVIGKLLERAEAAIKNAYAPYSNFRVGAAVLTEKGNIYGGCNVENASFGATICAERGAAMTAVEAEGKTKFRALAIVSQSFEPAPPCALCRQFFSEFADTEMQVYLLSLKSGTYRHTNFGSLLPFAFEFEDK